MDSKRNYKKWKSLSVCERTKLLDKLAEGAITASAAARELGVDRKTLYRHLAGKTQRNVGRPASASKLRANEQINSVRKCVPTTIIPSEDTLRVPNGALSVDMQSVPTQDEKDEPKLSEIFDTPLLLNKHLKRKALFIEERKSEFREYQFQRQNRNGCWFYCCSSCKPVGRKGQRAWVHLSQDKNSICRRQWKHRCRCDPLTIKQVAILEIERKMRLRVLTKLQVPNQAYEEAMNECYSVAEKMNWVLKGTGSFPALFPAWHEVQKQLYRLRTGSGPNIKRDDVYQSLPTSAYASTLFTKHTEPKEEWLLSISQQLGAIVFSSDRNVQVMSNSEIIQIDGTFKTAPHGFYQILTIHAEHKGEWCVVATALMENKSESSYRFVLSALRDKCLEMGLNLQPKRVLTDFEVAEMNAAIATFGDEACKGCLFHFTKAVLTKMRNLSLTRHYKRVFGDDTIYRWVRRIIALSLIHPKLVPVLWQKHLQTPPSVPVGWLASNNFRFWPTHELKSFSDYFIKVWMQSSTFPVRRWNHHRSGIHRTTNAAEAHHSKLSRASSTLIHPSIDSFLNALQQRHAFQQTRIDQLDSGKPPKEKSKKYVALNNRLDEYHNEFSLKLRELAMKGCATESPEVIQASLEQLDRCAWLMADLNYDGTATAKQQRQKAARILVNRAIASRPQPVRKFHVKIVNSRVANPVLIHWSTKTFSDTCPVDNIMCMLVLEVQFNPKFLGCMKGGSYMTAHLRECIESIATGTSIDAARDTFFHELVKSIRSANGSGAVVNNSLKGSEREHFLNHLGDIWFTEVSSPCTNQVCARSRSNPIMHEIMLVDLFQKIVNGTMEKCVSCKSLAAISSIRLLNKSVWIYPISVDGTLSPTECIKLPLSIEIDGVTMIFKGLTLFNGADHFTATIAHQGSLFYYDAIGPTFRPLDETNDFTGKIAASLIYLVEC